jgi:hypothetical protein
MWEYKQVTVDIKSRLTVGGRQRAQEQGATEAEKILDELGAQGWELVGMVQAMTLAVTFFLKRQVPS